MRFVKDEINVKCLFMEYNVGAKGIPGLQLVKQGKWAGVDKIAAPLAKDPQLVTPETSQLLRS